MTYFTQNAHPNEITGWRSPVVLLMIMAGAMQLSFAAWWNLMNNFAVNELDFSGREIGIQQSIREIPGFLSFWPFICSSSCANKHLPMYPCFCSGSGLP